MQVKAVGNYMLTCIAPYCIKKLVRKERFVVMLSLCVAASVRQSTCTATVSYTAVLRNFSPIFQVLSF